MAEHSHCLVACFKNFGYLSVLGGPITITLGAHSGPFPLISVWNLSIKPAVLAGLCSYLCFQVPVFQLLTNLGFLSGSETWYFLFLKYLAAKHSVNQ